MAKSNGVTLGIIGTGEASPEAVCALLDDLLTAADNEGSFILPVTRDHFTDTIAVVADWLIDSKIPFDAVTDDESANARNLKKYLQAAETTHNVKGIPLKMTNLLEKADDGRLLVLWNDDDGECYDALERASKKGVKAFDLTNALDELEFGEPDETGTWPTFLSPGDDAYQPYTREELEDMEFDALKQIVQDFRDNGFEPDIPPRSRSKTYIEQILLMQDAAPDEGTPEEVALAEAAGEEIFKEAMAAKAETVVVNQSIDLAETNEALEVIGATLINILNKLGETLEFSREQAAKVTVEMRVDPEPDPDDDADEKLPATTMPARRVPPRR